MRETNEGPGGCQMACLDVLDTCVAAVGYSSAECYRTYSACGDDCDGIDRPEDVLGED